VIKKWSKIRIWVWVQAQFLCNKKVLYMFIQTYRGRDIRGATSIGYQW